MIDVSYEEAVEAIQKATGLSIDDIGRRVAEKLETLGGLVTRDGAIHILANELGVTLTRAAGSSDGTPTKIKDITLRSRNLLVTGRVVKKYDAKTFNKNGREGRVASLLLGDETGVTRLVFWNEQVDVWNELKEKDVLVVRNPFVKQSYMQDRTELQLNTQSTMVVNPEGVTVENRPGFSGGGFQERAAPTQKYIKDLQDGDENVELVATVVQVYDPRFFDSCPQCNKKVMGDQCATHGAVTPVPNWSMSAFLDDGMGNVRASFWKQQSLKFTGKTEKDFLLYRDDPTAFEDVKTQLLGEIVKVVGKAKRNETFDRLEFTANLVFTDVDPQAELEGLQKKFETAKKNLPESSSLESDAVVEQPVAKDTGDGLNVVEDDIISLDDLDK